MIESRPTSKGSKPWRNAERFRLPSPAGFPFTNSLRVPPPSLVPSGVNSVFNVTLPCGQRFRAWNGHVGDFKECVAKRRLATLHVERPAGREGPGTCNDTFRAALRESSSSAVIVCPRGKSCGPIGSGSADIVAEIGPLDFGSPDTRKLGSIRSEKRGSSGKTSYFLASSMNLACNSLSLSGIFAARSSAWLKSSSML